MGGGDPNVNCKTTDADLERSEAERGLRGMVAGRWCVNVVTMMMSEVGGRRVHAEARVREVCVCVLFMYMECLGKVVVVAMVGEDEKKGNPTGHRVRVAKHGSSVLAVNSKRPSQSPSPSLPSTSPAVCLSVRLSVSRAPHQPVSERTDPTFTRLGDGQRPGDGCYDIAKRIWQAGSSCSWRERSSVCMDPISMMFTLA